MNILRWVVLAMVLNLTADAAQFFVDDEAAYAMISERFPFQGYTARVHLPNESGWLYEVGRIDLFGRRLMLGRGSSWESAFAVLDRPDVLEPPVERRANARPIR